MRILFITLSNLGDVIISLPLLDILRDRYPEAKTTVLCGARAYRFLEEIKDSEEIVAYRRPTDLRTFLEFIKPLRKENFDIVIDLKNTLIPLFLKTKLRTPLFMRFPKNCHSLERFLIILRRTLRDDINLSSPPRVFSSSLEERERLKEMINSRNLKNKKVVFLGVGARSHLKRYTPEGFRWIIEKIMEEEFFPVVVGDENDREIAEKIKRNIQGFFLDLSGRVSLREVGILLEEFDCISISCDSAFLHLSSYLGIPTLGIFGPTSPQRYGPWSSRKTVVFLEELNCRPCERAQCRYDHECMRKLEPERVWRAFKNLTLQNIH